MKKIIAIIAVALPLAFSARAQWIVYDPISNVQQILDQAENIAEYVDMVDNQVQQIETLDNQLSEFKNYESLFGNPSQVVLSMVPNLDSDLQSLEPGKNLENLVSSADGNYALTYNDSGIYATVGAMPKLIETAIAVLFTAARPRGTSISSQANLVLAP